MVTSHAAGTATGPTVLRLLTLYGITDKVEREQLLLRKERQRPFAVGGTRLWAIIDEVALRRPVGGPAVD